MTDQRLTLTVEETAEILGIGRASAYAACAAGEIPGVIRLGRRVLVSRHALMSLLNADEPAADRLDGKTPEDARHAPS